MKFTKRFLGLALSMIVAITGSSMTASAETLVQTMQMAEADVLVKSVENVYEGVNNFERLVQSRGNGIIAASLNVTPRTSDILIDVSTTCSFIASKVGVREVYVQEKVWYGWKTIAQAADYNTNSNVFSGETSCTNAVKGKTYRVLCTHYAIESNGTEHTVSNQSEEFVYN